MKYIFSIILLFAAKIGFAQNIESIHFHLYTDSLKKGQHNYINVDGKMDNGAWRPLTARDLNFSSDYGKFEGNDLVLPETTLVKKVNITATLKADTKKTKQVTIWIKQKPDPPLSDENINPSGVRKYPKKN